MAARTATLADRVVTQTMQLGVRPIIDVDRDRRLASYSRWLYFRKDSMLPRADAVLTIGSFVQVRGGFAFSKSAPILATLSNGTSKNLQVTTFGFSGLSAFVG